MTLGRGTVFQPNFFFKPDFDQGMLACHDMFDMFSFTYSSSDIGMWHCFSAYFFFKPDLYQGMLACHDMFDMVLFTCLSCDMGLSCGRVWEVARLAANGPWRCDVTAPVMAQ